MRGLIPVAVELDVAPLETAKKEKQALLSVVASYIAKRVELRLSKLQMNRVSISLYSVMKTTGEVKDAYVGREQAKRMYENNLTMEEMDFGKEQSNG